jgi:enoyl-[acyl-carrier-protein] reductase (NADH)
MSNNLLKGKKGIVFGALDEKSIAWKTALKCYEEGAQLILQTHRLHCEWVRSINWLNNAVMLL